MKIPFLLELKGKGCRQFESYLLAQERSWYDFFMDALVEGGVMKRLDLAINDRTGLLDIPESIEKCKNEECISKFRSFKNYGSGELVKHNEARALYSAKNAELATKAGCPYLENAETDRCRQSDGLSQNH